MLHLTSRYWLWLLAGLALAGRAGAQAAPTARWATSWGAAGDDRHVRVTRDGAGNVYAAGWTQPAPAQPYRLNVVKYDFQGRQLWAQQWECAGGDIEPRDIAVDASGNVWVAGLFGGYYWGTPGVPHTVTFGATTLTAGNQLEEIFLVKLDPAGNVLWARQTQSAYRSTCSSLAVDAAGNAYLTGQADQTVRFGSRTLVAPVGSSPGFVVRYDAQGTAQWAKALNSQGSLGSTNRVATDAAGNCYLLSAVDAAFTLGGVSIVPAAYSTADFLTRLDAQGDVVWARQLPPAHNAFHYLAVTPDGSIRVSQQITQPTTYGSQTFVPAGGFAVLVLGFTPQGAYQWGRQFGGPLTTIGNSDQPGPLVVEADGTSYALLRLGGMQTLTQPSGVSDSREFLASFTAAGVKRWERPLPDRAPAGALTLMAPDDLVLAGEAYQPDALDGLALTCQGHADAFTARLNLTPGVVLPPVATVTTPTGPGVAPEVLLPNVLTPNDDGLNDAFAPRNLPAGVWQLRVYSRWGQPVYQAADYQLNWSAAGLAAGTYYYRLTAPGQPAYQGWVEVVR